MRSLRTAAAAAALCTVCIPALAQQAPPPGAGTTQLPEIVVTPPPQPSPAPTTLPTTTSTPAPVQQAVPKSTPKAASKAIAQPKQAPAPKQVAQPAPKAAPQTQPVATTAPPPAAVEGADPAAVGPASGTRSAVQAIPGAATASTQSATPSDIAATSGPTLTDSLQAKPGVIGSTFAPGANRPILRGLDNTRVRVQENGVSTGDVSDVSEDHAITVNPCAADVLEVAHGPALLAYTGKAVGGLVNVDNQRVPGRMPERGVEGEVRGGLNSVDRGRDGCFRALAGSRGFVVYADGFARSSEDYRTPQGRQLNSFVEADGYSVGGSYVWSSGYVGAAYSRFDSFYGIPGEEAAEERPRINLGQDKITAKAEFRPRAFGIDAIRVLFGHTNYRHHEVIFEAADGVDVIGSTFLNRLAEGRVEVQHLPIATGIGILKGTAGIQLGQRRLAGLSQEGDNLIEPSKTRSIAGFVAEELALTDRLKVTGTIRIDRDRVSGATFEDTFDPTTPIVGRERSFAPVSGGLGLTYDLPIGVVARLSALHAERSPEAQELFSKGAHEATGTFEIGSPDLEKERARTIELGFKRTQGPFRFDTALYAAWYKGFIFREFTGETCEGRLDSCTPAGGGGDLDQVVFRQIDAMFYGLELSGELDIAEIGRGVWGVSGRYDFTRAKFDGAGNVPRIPPHRLGGGVYYRDGAWRAEAGVLHAFRQDQIASNETPTNGYTLVAVQISYRMKLSPDGGSAPEFEIGLKGENLLDDDVRNHVSFKKDEVLLPGRNARLFGVLRF